MKENVLKLKWLIIPLVLILVGSFLAGMFNTSFYGVSVSRVDFETSHGTLSGWLYMPDGAGADNPHPVIVTTHGYLNSGEMQDILAVEMSRRGFIVLALDMYDHGRSRWDADIPVGMQFLTFWIHAQWNAAQWAFEQPWALRDANGNGMIAVSGHSMGGFSSTVAIHRDEIRSLTAGYRIIHAGLSVGADLSHSANLTGIPAEQLIAAYGSRTVGFIAGLYDEFFFNEPGTFPAGQTVRRFDWTETTLGRLFLGIDPEAPIEPHGAIWFNNAQSGELWMLPVDAEAGPTVIRESQTGRRIIFTPNEIHPWNHFSATSANYIIEFFDEAFDGYAPTQEAGGQIWQWKVFFNFITLIGYFMLVVPLAGLLLKLPFFKLATTEKQEPVPIEKGTEPKILFWVVIGLSALLPAGLIPMLMERREAGLAVFGVIALCLAVVALIAGIVLLITAKGDAKRRTFGVGGVVVAVISTVIWLIARNPGDIVALSPFYMAPAVNTIAYWALMSGVLALLITAALFFFSKRSQGATLANYGIVPKPLAIIAGLATAIVVVAVLYALLFVMELIFGVDARIFTLAIRTLNWEAIVTALRYIPVFLVFYFFNTVAITANAQGRKGGVAIAIILNMGGIAIWLAIQYITLFQTGVAWYPTMALNAILLFALAPVLAVAAVYAYKLFQKTNNVFLPAFLNTIFFTLIIAANTAVFWNMV